MADRETVIAALHCRAYDDDFPCWKCAYYKQDEKPVARCEYRRLMDDAIALLKEQEAKEQLSDAVHETAKQFRQTIVRCKDCKWWHESKTNNGFGDCGQANGITLKSSDWFCADGTRRDYVKPVTESATDWDGINCE